MKWLEFQVVSACHPVTNPSALMPVSSPGNSQPGNQFTFSAGSYHFNWKSMGLASGTYVFYFQVAGDPVIHSLQLVLD